jgi:hypothetical protein
MTALRGIPLVDSSEVLARDTASHLTKLHHPVKVDLALVLSSFPDHDQSRFLCFRVSGVSSICFAKDAWISCLGEKLGMRVGRREWTKGTRQHV